MSEDKNHVVKKPKSVSELKNHPILKKSLKLNIFFAAIFIVGISVLTMPFWPQAEYSFNRTFFPKKFEESYYFDKVAIANHLPGYRSGDPQERAPEEEPKTYYNDIVIPAIGLDVNIIRRPTEEGLKYGAWIKPDGAVPGEIGNTIITGHRYQYFGGVRPFYHLGKVDKNDPIYVFWQGEKMEYKIEKKIIVKANEVWVEEPRGGETLTIYTCEGMEAAERLVLMAKPV